MIFVGESHPLAVSAKRVDMGASAQSAGSEGSDDISGVKIFMFVRIICVNDHAATMKGGILPLIIRVFRAMNENDAIVGRACRRNSAMGFVPRFE